MPLFCRYASGEVRLWDTRTWDYTAPVLAAAAGPGGAGAPPHVCFVRINSSLAVAAYEDGEQPQLSSLLQQQQQQQKGFTKMKQLCSAFCVSVILCIHAHAHTCFYVRKLANNPKCIRRRHWNIAPIKTEL